MEKTITIGSQVWTIENLNVSSYRNGDLIPEVQDQKEWAKLRTGAWCYFENDTANGIIYGKLYNWYAVNDPRGLAPKGYHIPTDTEWTKLCDNLGGEEVAGAKMKSTTNWDDDGNGTNSSGFAGLPGGFRSFMEKAGFWDIGENGFWFSSSEFDTDSAWGRNLNLEDGALGKKEEYKRFGLSVRCLRD